ncbi:acyltransferase [Sphingobacterium sp. PCS056]|uniref:acyltransferase family protein n=1 Tax=Sphingobacterium sp. PCS056 TaxID=2931400 RepID=UPI00200C33A1|nr:acyltransferase family protein [Sphingobacterium sp. PCS056]UPZ38019.1 acyltransferase [Sphingobacterium sp. PCS056]
MSFRYDIGLLRAIAVCFVLFYHYQIPFFEGGYIGVDIFFVISGFLMTKIILADVKNKSFSYLDFVCRRIKRIVPAQLFVATVMLLVLPLLYFDVDLKMNAKYIAVSLAFISNIYYATLSGDYFSPEYQDNLFLHSWSLAVEWQFYLLYPVILLLLRRMYFYRFHRFRYFMIGLSILSFTAGLWYPYAQSWSFYMMPTRAWEFLLGALGFLYSRELRYAFKSILVPITVGMLGLLFLSVIFFDIGHAWPSTMIVIPVIATMIILALDIQFSWYKIPAIQFLGKISYSLYLWHWPIYVLYKKYEFLMQSPYWIFLVFFLSFFFAIISYYLVERNKNNLSVKKLMIVAFFLISNSMILFIWPKNMIWNYVRRIDSSYIHYFQYEEYQHLNPCNCYITRSDRYDNYDQPTCLKIDSAKENILLMGDSHAAQLSTALRNVLTKEQHLLEMSLSLTFPFPSPKGYQKSVDLWRYFYQEFLPQNHEHVHKIFISVHWLMHNDDEMNYTPAEIKAGLQQIINIFDHYGIDYYFIGQIEYYRIPYRQIALKKLFNPEMNEYEYSVEEAKDVNNFMKRIIPSGHYIDLYKNKEIAHHSVKEHMPYIYDRHHLTDFGAREVVNYLTRHGYL